MSNEISQGQDTENHRPGTPAADLADRAVYKALNLNGVPSDFGLIATLMDDHVTALEWLRDGEPATWNDRVYATAGGTDDDGRRWVDFKMKETRRYWAPDDIRQLRFEASPCRQAPMDLAGCAVQIWTNRWIEGLWLTAPGTSDRYCIVTEEFPSTQYRDEPEDSPEEPNTEPPATKTTTAGNSSQAAEPSGVMLGLFRLAGHAPDGQDKPCSPDEIKLIGHDRIWLPTGIRDRLMTPSEVQP